MERKLLSGFQDFLPERMIARNVIIETVRRCYEQFGFLPQDTPALEYTELLLGKYGEGEKLIYNFRDRGGRDIALRYDLTVPLARVVREYSSEITLPYRRYQIGKVWRADRPGKGRYREFIQIDADIVGDDSLLSDLDMILVMIEIMRRLKVPARVRMNSRQVLDGLLATCAVTESRGVEILRAVDKFDKIGAEGVLKEVARLELPSVAIDTITAYLQISGSSDQVVSSLEELLQGSEELEAGLVRLTQIANTLASAGVSEALFSIDPTIARGLDYYTGIIFETLFTSDPEFGSVCSGGRYDRLITDPSGKQLPSVGTSIGLDRLFAAMQSQNLLESQKTTTQVLIVNFGDEYLTEYVKLANELRADGFSVEIFTKPAKLAKQLKIASAKEILSVIIAGPDELARQQVIVKNMLTGEQRTIARQEVSSTLRG